VLLIAESQKLAKLANMSPPYLSMAPWRCHPSQTGYGRKPKTRCGAAMADIWQHCYILYAI
jgi:hypothetical protein